MANVKIYTTPVCVYCKMAKEFFKTNNIQYEEIDVVAHPEEGQAVFQKVGQQAVPVIDVNGELFLGFDRKGLARALGISA